MGVLDPSRPNDLFMPVEPFNLSPAIPNSAYNGLSLSPMKQSTKRNSHFALDERQSEIPFPKSKLNGTKKPKIVEEEDEARANKGLRHFSMKVCEKVEEKLQTTYNEVAECLVRELTQPNTVQVEKGRKIKYDEKNIRRRVYDALNVLMAMDIIKKDKKTIFWQGLPGAVNQDVEELKIEKEAKQKRIHQKKEQLSQILQELVCYNNLIKRNMDPERKNSTSPRLSIPFVLVHSRRSTNSSDRIECEMTEDRSLVYFKFGSPFTVREDREVMKHLGLTSVVPYDLERIIPTELIKLYPQDKIISVNNASTATTGHGSGSSDAAAPAATSSSSSSSS